MASSAYGDSTLIVCPLSDAGSRCSIPTWCSSSCVGRARPSSLIGPISTTSSGHLSATAFSPWTLGWNGGINGSLQRQDSAMPSLRTPRKPADLFPAWERQGKSCEINAVDWMMHFVLNMLGEVALSHLFGGMQEAIALMGSKRNVDGFAKDDEESLYRTFEMITSTLVKRRQGTPLDPYFPTRANCRFACASARLNSVIDGIVTKQMREQQLLQRLEENAFPSPPPCDKNKSKFQPLRQKRQGICLCSWSWKMRMARDSSTGT